MRLRYSAAMKRACAFGVALVMVAAPWARGQGSLTYLEKELEELRQKHDEAATNGLKYFFASLETAENDPAAAEKLYISAGGAAPAKAVTIKAHDQESQAEAEKREEVDKATQDSLGGALALQCGLMRFAALMITAPNTPNLQTDFVAWLKQAATVYPQVLVTVSDPRRTDQGPVDVSGPIRGQALHDSPIAGFLGFHSWNGKDQSNWRVQDIPQLYRDNILEPLRKTPNADTMEAWGVYIDMMNASQPNPDQWTNVDYPDLQFAKGLDDFAMQPDPEKIEGLIALIKAHPDHPHVEQWFDAVEGLIKGLEKKSETAAAPAATGTTGSNNLPPILPDPPQQPSVRPQ